jgi:DNA-binding SARP family transcriptional activator
VKLLLFGGVHLETNDGRVIPIRTQRARALFAFLAMRPGAMVHREQVCTALWPDTDEPSARSQLRKALWRVRSSLKEGGACAALSVEDHQMGLFPRGLWTDIWAFAEALAQVELKHDSALDRGDAESLLSAVMLQRGDYAAELTDDWAQEEQARLSRARLAAMERLIAYHRLRGQYVQAIDWAQRALVEDNLREHLHRIIMGCHMSMGDRGSALRQYRACADILQAELGIGPMEETRALRDAIVEGADSETVEAALHGTCAASLPARNRRRPAGLSPPALSGLDTAIEALTDVQRSLVNAREELLSRRPR